MDTVPVIPGHGDAQKLMLFEANKKSTAVAYLLWFFLGGFGAHRFYSQRTGSAVAILLMTIFGALLAGIGIGLLLLIPAVIWVLVDAFLIPGWIRNYNNLLAHQLGA